MSPRFPALILALSPVAVLAAPTPDYGGLPTRYGYVELTDMALSARIVLAATIVRAVPLKGESATGVAADKTRYFVEATVTGLIAGQATPPAQVRYLVDIPSDIRKPKLKGVAVLLLANPGSNPSDVSLVGPRAQVPRTPENEQRLRAILTEAVAQGAPPAITGISRAFHVAGTLPGEGETQIFLRTADHRPISLSVLRRPGEDPRWAVALSELVDASATPPKRESFLWYRLACGLPKALPAESLDGADPADMDQAKADYQLVVDALGPCKAD
jgi:hypothetical protein